MTKINNGFSLFDFCKKRADKLQIYGEETLDEEGNIIPFIDQAALITHYLQLRNKNVNMPYEQQAKGILELWYEFVRGGTAKEAQELKLRRGIFCCYTRLLVSRFVSSSISSSCKSTVYIYRFVCRNWWL